MTTRAPHISVVVPFYNAEHTIARCIEGLLAQTYPADRYELIMVDNNSTDDSVRVAEDFRSVRLFSEAKQGAYAARNRGLREARGEIVAFTDPDCVPESDWLEQIGAALDEDGIRVVLGSNDAAGKSLGLSMMSSYEDAKNEYVFNSGVAELYFGHTNNMAVRRDLFEEVGLFVERMRGADTIFVHRVVDRFSCAAVRYRSSIRVCHLEIDRLSRQIRKNFVYGRSRRRYCHIADVRPLSSSERFQVLRQMLRRRDYSWPKVALFCAILAAGLLSWTLGDLAGRLTSEAGSTA